MRFLSLRAFMRFLTVALALHFSPPLRAQEMANDTDAVRYIEVADNSSSDGSSGQSSDSGSSDSSSDDGGADPDGTESDQMSAPEGSGRNGQGERFDGPSGALEAVQSDRALPLDGIVAIARHLTKGEIIDTRLHAVRGVLQYELKVLETNSEVRRYSFNARTGKLIRVR
ncbi:MULTISPECIES: PepSY domain-containing protein [unclassified Rhizobium]|uniref:PepSY domain-containing protein n=1 Tax=unclassified Rhizobium TaxID=2613769 RepID=UPI00380928AB